MSCCDSLCLPPSLPSAPLPSVPDRLPLSHPGISSILPSSPSRLLSIVSLHLSSNLDLVATSYCSAQSVRSSFYRSNFSHSTPIIEHTARPHCGSRTPLEPRHPRADLFIIRTDAPSSYHDPILAVFRWVHVFASSACDVQPRDSLRVATSVPTLYSMTR